MNAPKDQQNMDENMGIEFLNDPEQKYSIPPKEKPKSDGFWKFAFIVFAIFIPIRLFVAEPFLVYGSSMEPNFETGDYLIVDELSYKLDSPKRGDVIVLRPPLADQKQTHYIKRIIGLPGETVLVRNGEVTIINKQYPNGFVLKEPYLKFESNRGAEYTLGTDEYFVMGDNRPVSSDSRNWGPLKGSEITGRAFLRLYPFSQIQLLPGALNHFQNNS